MAFEGLTEKLNATFKKLRGKGRLTENDVREAMREVRLALLEADVGYKVVKDFVATVTERAVGSDVLDSLTPAQQVIKIVNEELTKLMGGGTARLSMANSGPTVVMMVGLQGAGKTTTTAKLAGLMRRQLGKRPLLAACDVYRAAIEQLKVVGGQLDLPVFEQGQGDPVQIAENAIRHARDHGSDMVFLDTAGRLHVDEALMDELKRMKATVHPNEILLVVDAMTGQDAVNAASAFDEALGIDGVVLTKLDGDARGGAALSMRSVTGKPIKFSGEGEKLDQFGPFVPGRMADRILGMGDIVGLVEHAAARIDEEQAAKSMDRMMSGKFDFNDFLDQMKMMQSLGPLEGLLGLLPGFGKIKKQLPEGALDPRRMKHMEAIVLSMTAKERSNPNLLNPSRRRRIAAGCGRPLMEVNKLIKNFSEMRKMMSGKGKMGAMMKQMASMKGKGGKVPGFPGMGGGLGGLKGLGGLGGGLGGLFGGRR